MEQNSKTAALHPLVLAVDGGGSRCRMTLVGEGLDLRVDLGPANASSDFDGALATCRTGLAQLATGLSRDLRAVPAYFGLAGIVDDAIAARFAAALPLDHVKVEEDRAAAVTGALGLRDGAVIHSGTGSFVALRHQGLLRCAGGWGPKLGDEGSAHWVGREILRAALAATDGLAEPCGLSTAVLDRFGDAGGVIAFASTATSGDIAALAPMLRDHGEDPTTRDILTRAAGYFARTLTALGWRGEVICPTGGLAPHIAPFLPAQMAAQLRPAQAEPLQGAILLAQQFAAQLGQQDDKENRS